jgi:hypothetical protein
MTNNKTKKFIIVIITVFILSFIYTIIDIYPTYNSAFDLGYSTGLIFGHMIKILGMLGLIILACKYFKK